MFASLEAGGSTTSFTKADSAATYQVNLQNKF